MTRNQRYYKKHRERILAERAEYYRENMEAIKAREKQRYLTKKDHIYAVNREWVARNLEHVKAYQKEYRKNNREKARRDKNNFYRKNSDRLNNERMTRYHNDELFRTTLRITTNIRHGVKRAAFFNSVKIIEHLGCSYKFLREHLESLFEDGMSWENRNEWHIDHIKPLSSAKDLDELYPLFHWTNLRPLWAHDNLSKWANPIPVAA